jgi:soluble lytic murein transglycosylase-like protein
MRPFCSILMMAVIVAVPAAAQQKPNSDEAELAAYRLTSDKLDRYAAANRSLAQIMKDKNDPDAAKSAVFVEQNYDKIRTMMKVLQDASQ